MKVKNPLLLLHAFTIFALMISCLFGSFLLFIRSSSVQQIQPTDRIQVIAGLADAQQILLGLAVVAALLSVLGPLFIIYAERAVADRPLTWKERPRAALTGILLFTPVMLFWLLTPYGEISRAIALANSSLQESILTASIIETFAVMFASIWALITVIFGFSTLRVVKEL